MLKTKVTELLGIEYPIICGGMNFISRAEFAAAVSNAGGFGIITSVHLETPERLREEIRRTKDLTDKPFGVNINLSPSVKPIPNKEFIEVIIEEKVKAVETAGRRSPETVLPLLKEGNIVVIHKAATVRHCLKGEQLGADMLTIVGFENGGATGMEDITTMVLVPALVDVARVPVLAGGGFADGRGLVAALSLGAEGVVMGTRFMATKECPIHPKYKDWLVKASERDTTLVMRSITNTHRVLRNKASKELAKLEARKATLEEMLPIIGRDSVKRVFLDGDLDAAIAFGGQCVGIIHDIPTVKELIDRIVDQAEAIYGRLGNMGLKGPGR